MAVELGLSDSKNRGLEPRHHIERRIGNRRTYTRETSERRRRDRRLNQLRSVVLTSLALAMPHQLRSDPLRTSPSGPRVSTTIDSVDAITPAKAYEGIIREAAVLYRVDPSLIRSVMQAESGVRRIGGLARRRDGADAADARDCRGVRRRAPVRSAREHHGGHASAARAARSAPRKPEARHRQLQRRSDRRRPLRRRCRRSTRRRDT